MAEAYLRYFGHDEFEVSSAGLSPEPIHPFVEEVMREEGISIDGQTSKSIDMYLGKHPFDYVFIVCREGEAECPKLYPFALRIERWALSDPAEVVGEKDNVLDAFRHTRDEIKKHMQDWLTTEKNVQ